MPNARLMEGEIQREIKPWSLISEVKGPDIPLFKMYIKTMRNPRNQSVLDAIVLEAKDTVNVVALDENGALLLVEQYRFGIDGVVLELPAGVIDENEDPLEAAKRELREETGYSSKNWVYLGVSYLNPAYVNNRCYHFYATDCRKTHSVNQDELEDIRMQIISKEEIPKFIGTQGIKDAVGKAALHLVYPPSGPDLRS